MNHAEEEFSKSVRLVGEAFNWDLNAFLAKVKEDRAMLARKQTPAQEFDARRKARIVTPERATLAAERLIDSHFANPDREHARTSIPVKLDDDDIVILDFLSQTKDFKQELLNALADLEEHFTAYENLGLLDRSIQAGWLGEAWRSRSGLPLALETARRLLKQFKKH